MIELVMVFVLGFLVSGLLTLLFLPAFRKREVRLSTRRLEMQMPLSMEEIVAERDQLRAVFATQQRQLEQKVEALQENRAKDLGELGRRATTITVQEGERKELIADLTRTGADLAARTQELGAAQAEIGALHQAHWGATTRIETSARKHDALEDEHRVLADVADERRVLIAGLETRIAGLEMSLEDITRRHEMAQGEYVEKGLALDKAVEERASLRMETTTAIARRDQLQASADALSERVGELERAHRAERRERVRLENETASALRAASDAAQRETALRAGLARQLEDVNLRERDLHQQIENLRAERSALEGALDVARREFAALRAERAALATNVMTPVTASPPAVAAEDAARLRQSISQIGEEVARLVLNLQDEAEEKVHAGAPQQAIGERVRDLQTRAKRTVPSH